MPGFGRIPQLDPHTKTNQPHDARFLLPPRRVPEALTYKYWDTPIDLDQGDTPQCVGYAGYGWLEGSPVRNKPKFHPTDLYHMAQDNDEWPGDDYDGSSTRGLMGALLKLGLISDYQWTFDWEAAGHHILVRGPLIAGTDWLSGMSNYRKDKEGRCWLIAEGEVEGGHEYRLDGYNVQLKNIRGTYGSFRMTNSWGRSWAKNNRAWMAREDLQILLNRQGECVTATEIKL
jgi:hypothetical protein